MPQVAVPWPKCSLNFYVCVPIADVYPVLSKPAAAAERNKSINFGGLCVYGLLTDFDHFIFYSFDPVANCYERVVT